MRGRADAHQTADASTATDPIRTWAGRHGDMPQGLEARLEEHLYVPTHTATSRYVPSELPEDALHDFGPIHIDFHELVLIDRLTATLTLLVAADDQSVACWWSNRPYAHGRLNRPTRMGG
ncbi:hypothetical protein ACFVZD_30835 [Streptomyces sp. NPDC058287]|uniref:hypothetical protein n=1 Tax=unclassified Streptomyces TaxID=2593676 RepID=UPI0036E71429